MARAIDHHATLLRRRHHNTNTEVLGLELESHTQEGYEAYAITRRRDLNKHLTRVAATLYPLVMLLCFFRWIVGIAGTAEFAWSVLPTSVMFVSVLAMRSKLETMGSRMSTLIQTFVWVYTSLTFALWAYAASSELARHRLFLTLQLPSFNLLTTLGYAPPRVHNLILCSWNFILWLLFHWSIDFFNLPCILYGAFWNGFSCYLNNYLDADAWKKFEDARVLEKERQFLRETHETLQCMLASLFDASCTCDPEGVLLSSTPHLDDLLVGSKQFDKTASLSDFLASSVEAQRLQQFLKRIHRSGNHQAHIIHISMLAAGSPTEVKLYGILLPACTYRINAHSACIFIGLQAQGTPTVAVAEACGADMLNSNHGIWNKASEDMAACVLDARSTHTVDDKGLHERAAGAAAQEWYDDDDSVTLGSLSISKDTSSHAIAREAMLAMYDDNGSVISQALTVAKQLGRSSAAQKDVFTQTDVSTAEGSLKEQQEECAGISSSDRNDPALCSMTLPTAQADLQSPGCCFPKRRQCLTREQRFLESRMAHPQRIKMNSSKRILSQFLETPTATLTVRIMEFMRCANTCARGCCPYHINAAKIGQIAKKLFAGPCRKDFGLYTGWQCYHCKSLNEYCGTEDADDDDDEPICCLICGQEKLEQHTDRREFVSHLHVDSGNSADLEPSSPDHHTMDSMSDA